MQKQPCPPLTVATEGARPFLPLPPGFAPHPPPFLRAHRGPVTVQSHEGKGSRFSVLLPRATA